MRVIPARRTLSLLARDRLAGFEAIGRECDGVPARISLGPVRAYLLTHPDHVGRVLSNQDGAYLREGMLWEPIQRLEGYGIAGEGPRWRTSRRILHPLLTLRHTNTLVPAMAQGVNEALDRLAQRADDGRPVDVLMEMMRITHRVLIRVFFGNRIDDTQAERLGRAVNEAFESLSWRIALPFVSGLVPMPGDGRFRRATRIADEIIYPLIKNTDNNDDLVSHFVDAKGDNDAPLSERQIRDDLVAMFVAGTETTALMLTWLWVLLDAHPHVAAQLAAEADEVVADGVPAQEHLPRLVHAKAALQEALRMYPIGWILPRKVASDVTIDGVRLRAGSTVVLSPYLTHRLVAFWPEPHTFDPQRFIAGDIARHSFIPFGAGEHNCLGQHFSLAEAALAVAGLLVRFRPEIVRPQSLLARPTASLRPRQRALMVLRPRR